MPTNPSYQLGVDSAVVLKCGTADQSVVKGLNKLGLPSLMREVIKISEFRTDFAVEFTGEGSHGRITFGGNMVIGDTKGQDQLKKYLLANTKISDARCYLDLVNFIAPDLANDPQSGWQVSKHEPGEGQKNGTFPYSGEFVLNGRYCYFTNHLVEDATPTIAFVADTGTGATITDSTSRFVTAGFKAGDTMIIEGSTTNDKQVLIKTVAAGVITLAAGSTLVAGTAVEGTTLHSGTI